MITKRRRHSAAYILRVGLDAPDGSKTTSRLPSVHETQAKPIQAWNRRLLYDGAKTSTSGGDYIQVPTITPQAEQHYGPFSEPAAFVWMQLTFPFSLSKPRDPL